MVDVRHTGGLYIRTNRLPHTEEKITFASLMAGISVIAGILLFSGLCWYALFLALSPLIQKLSAFMS